MQTATQPECDQQFDPVTLDTRRAFDRSRSLKRDETNLLISSDRVEGTGVFTADGEQIGLIDRMMFGRSSGRANFAVMSFGGFLGVGESFAPIPWKSLNYDTDRGGYVVNIDKGRLKDAPSFGRNSEPKWNRDYSERVSAYYGFIY